MNRLTIAFCLSIAVADHLAAIESAADVASLKAAFESAVADARKIGDKQSEQVFVKAKDARKPKVAA